jgi:hypothetical protein
VIPGRPKAWAICLGLAQVGLAQIAQTAGQPRWTGISPNTVRSIQTIILIVRLAFVASRFALLSVLNSLMNQELSVVASHCFVY